MKFPTHNIIDNWLQEHGDPLVEKYVEKNLAIVDKVHAVLKERGIKKKEFAQMLGKSSSEVTKWLSGLHNLTLKSITKMEEVLAIDLINIEPVVQIEYVYLGSIKGGKLEDAISEYEQTTYNEAI